MEHIFEKTLVEFEGVRLFVDTYVDQEDDQWLAVLVIGGETSEYKGVFEVHKDYKVNSREEAINSCEAFFEAVVLHGILDTDKYGIMLTLLALIEEGILEENNVFNKDQFSFSAN